MVMNLCLANLMHQYKVHLPQRNNWDEDYNMMESFYMSGINSKPYYDEEDNLPSSLDEIPINIEGTETE